MATVAFDGRNPSQADLSEPALSGIATSLDIRVGNYVVSFVGLLCIKHAAICRRYTLLCLNWLLLCAGRTAADCCKK